MSKIDWTKPIQTVNGEKAEVLKLNLNRAGMIKHCILVRYHNDDHPILVDTDGRAANEQSIINSPNSLVRYVNFYRDPDTNELKVQPVFFNNRYLADQPLYAKSRAGCKRIEFFEGEYDD